MSAFVFKAMDLAGTKAGGVVAVSPAGDEEDAVILGDGLADGFDEDGDADGEYG